MSLNSSSIVEELSAGRSDGLFERRHAQGLRSGVRAKKPKKKRGLRPKNVPKKETRGKYCMLRLPVLYYKPSSLNDKSFPSGIETPKLIHKAFPFFQSK